MTVNVKGAMLYPLFIFYFYIFRSACVSVKKTKQKTSLSSLKSAVTNRGKRWTFDRIQCTNVREYWWLHILILCELKQAEVINYIITIALIKGFIVRKLWENNFLRHADPLKVNINI